MGIIWDTLYRKYRDFGKFCEKIEFGEILVDKKFLEAIFQNEFLSVPHQF